MNVYIRLITNVIEYIEANVQENLSLEHLAQVFGFSAFHFNRIFRAVTGSTLKQYILGRKLSLAMERLAVRPDPIIEVAYDFGFQSPEVFSRAFKKRFGISPHHYRQNRPTLDPVEKAVVVERDLINVEGQLALQGREVDLPAIPLAGVQLQVNATRPDFAERLRRAGDDFTRQAGQAGQLDTRRLYALVNCLGEDTGEYQVFYGMQALPARPDASFLPRTVPAGRYASFAYTGDMFDIRQSFINDLYRWLIVREIELANNGIGMLNVFQADYEQTHQVDIYVPVKSPGEVSKKCHAPAGPSA